MQSKKNFQIIAQIGKKSIWNEKVSKDQPICISSHAQHFFLKDFFPRFIWIFKESGWNGNIQWLNINDEPYC